MEIRPAGVADYEGLSSLLLQLHPDQPGAFRLEEVRQGHRSFVAVEGGRVVGFLFGTFVDYGLHHESAGTIEQLVVDQNCRGRGIGKALVEQWKSWLRDEGLALGFVSTTDELAAVGFYERAGFKRCTGPWLVWAELEPRHDVART